MSLGVDTDDALNTINWSDWYSWKPQYPTWAGRYFGNLLSWKYPEFTDAKSSTGGVLRIIAPLTAPNAANQQTGGTNGNDLGASDGQATCSSIEAAITQGQLTIPASGVVYVYLDVEPGINITPAYWAGWANEVNSYVSGGNAPFVPAVYTTMTESGGLYYRAGNVTYALGKAASDYPSQFVTCAGYWASEPEPCAACQPGYDASSAFSQCGTYVQPVGGGNTADVSVLLWQYAEQHGCTVTCGVTGFAGGQTLDIDGSDSTGADNYMLVIG
ncbi:MAG: hypothetical protein ACP5OV_01555 [Acidimicrobiales bacterium]